MTETKPWHSSYEKNVPFELEEDLRPLHAFFETAVLKYGERPCIDFLGKKYTYNDIAGLVDRATKGFQLLGVKKGVKVGLCLPNCPYYVICYYAVLSAGGTVVNFNPLYAPKEIEFQATDSQTDIMVTLDLKQLYPKVAKLIKTSTVKKIVICTMTDILPPLKSVMFNVFKRSELIHFDEDLQHITFDNLIKNDGACDPVTIDQKNDIAVLQYTGGTTGTPKGAILTHANLVANLRQVRAWCPNVDAGHERMLCALPFFHVFAMTVSLNLAISSGMELIMVPRFEVTQVLKIINAQKPTFFPGVPTIYNAISSHPKMINYDLTSLKCCISGGAPLPLDIKNKFEAVTECQLVEGYGLSECSPVASCNPLGGVSKEGSIGIALPETDITIRSLDPPYQCLNIGEKGEICISGPQVMQGYWKRPSATDETFFDDALRTGDVGYMDEDGYVFIIDRAKDMILCSGYNVYPRNIEDAIYRHKAVDEVTVIGVDDAHKGQVPKAFIRLKDGYLLTETDLKLFLHDYLSPIERPNLIEFRDQLPKTMIGKLSKKELKEEEKNIKFKAAIS